MKPMIVVADGFDKELFQKLKDNNTFEVYPKAKLTPQELDEVLPKTNGLVIRSATTVTSDLLAKAPQLKYVIRAGEGTDNIDKSACQAKDVRVSNTPGANNNSAAEQAINLMFACLRMTNATDLTTKQGKWEKARFVGLELWKKTIGIVGFGRIGQIVAKRLQGFENEILFFDPSTPGSPVPGAQACNSLEELFKRSDIITIHTPLNDSTKNLVTKSLINQMKKTGILVNAARGGIVNEKDLYEVLKEKKIWAAGFDVFEQEPVDPKHPLLSLENFICSPHVGASTEEAQFRVGEMVIEQLDSFFNQQKLLNEVRA